MRIVHLWCFACFGDVVEDGQGCYFLLEVDVVDVDVDVLYIQKPKKKKNEKRKKQNEGGRYIHVKWIQSIIISPHKKFLSNLSITFP